MRTVNEIHQALQQANVQELARISRVNAKTIYRIKASPEYRASAADAEAISNALDELAKAKPTVDAAVATPQAA